jgi:hypothetical protein
MARFRALNIAGWAYLLRQKSAELRRRLRMGNSGR